jgi:hypothetical protein
MHVELFECTLGKLAVGRLRRKWENNIMMDFRYCG